MKSNTVGPESPEQLKAMVEKSLDANKAEDITTIDLRGHSALADYMVIATGRSSRQVAALAEKIRDRLKASGIGEVRLEGVDKGDWAVVDAGDIIVHIFRPEVRDYYDLEKMWQTPHLHTHKANVLTL
ncbi:MAG TPA: ribosome silencing factor [Patescibacteria group bacterium]|nr:ribosome silencing factor [Patescibacteria group bacterium]